MDNTVKDIVKVHLELNGFGGLVDSEGECGCDMEDLMECDEPHNDCEAGYKVMCNGFCDYSSDRLATHYHITKTKPEPKSLEEVEG